MIGRPMPTSRDLAVRCARAVEERKAAEIVVLDLRKLCDFADYFVLATGRNARQVLAMRERLIESLGPAGVRPLGEEGEGSARWVLVDLNDVVVHLFQEEARRFYNLESLWGDAPRVRWDEDGAAPAPAV